MCTSRCSLQVRLRALDNATTKRAGRKTDRLLRERSSDTCFPKRRNKGNRHRHSRCGESSHASKFCETVVTLGSGRIASPGEWETHSSRLKARWSGLTTWACEAKRENWLSRLRQPRIDGLRPEAVCQITKSRA